VRVAVLKGGRSLERAVSLSSGERVEDALVRLGHEVVGIDVGPSAAKDLAELAPEVAFIALHGREGEDGMIQELLNCLGIPYTGSDPSACLRCFDKALAKHLLRAAGVPTPPFFAFSEGAVERLGLAAALRRAEEQLGLPLVVKPAAQGSALGVKFVRDPDQLPQAIVGALSYDRKFLLERYVEGRELAVSVIADQAGQPQALPVVEVLAAAGSYNFESRYNPGLVDLSAPAQLPAAVAARAQALALRCFELLGCHGFARVDMILERGEEALWVLEVNAVPGLTPTSLLPVAAKAAGIGFDQVVERILASAFSRGATAAPSLAGR
jgi:D-alanine-D-alanine ligase